MMLLPLAVLILSSALSATRGDINELDFYVFKDPGDPIRAYGDLYKTLTSELKSPAVPKRSLEVVMPITITD
jgi:hypothetical protein